MTTNAFHIEATLCYDTTCTDNVPVRWVKDFDGTDTSAYSLIMLFSPVGSRVPGIYVKTCNRKWDLLIPYDEASEIFSTSTHSLKAIISNTQTLSVDSDNFVFRNGQRQDPAALEPSAHDVWAICEPLSSGNSVTKDDNAASEGLIQISAGPDKSIKDYIPPTAGVVTVDSDGKIGVEEYIPLMSGGGLHIGNILKP